jgi:flagellar biogenesis protein FliO
VETWNQFGAVVTVLGALIGLLLWLKKRGLATAAAFRGSSGRVRELTVIDRVIVAPQHTLVLVEVSKQRMLVCLSPGGSQVTILEGGAQQ